jgi:DNA topoisomerase VI subunit A
MDRRLDLSPALEVSITKEWDRHQISQIATIIIEYNNEYFYIQEEMEKILDISQMPQYIKEDWIRYNKKDLTDKIIISHIKEYEELKESQWPSEDAWDSALSRLKAIKRSEIIRKIL